MAEITFGRLSDVPSDQILSQMTDPRVIAHLPLLTEPWTQPTVKSFVAMKEAFWDRDGLGHWAFLHGGRYVGWGGFQKEGDEWDFGLVLTGNGFGLGPRIAAAALDFAYADPRIPFVTLLLPPSRRSLSALKRLGAQAMGVVTHDGATFHKFRLETPAPS